MIINDLINENNDQIVFGAGESVHNNVFSVYCRVEVGDELEVKCHGNAMVLDEAELKG